MCRQTAQITEHKCDFPKQRSNTKTNRLSACVFAEKTAINNENSAKYLSFFLWHRKHTDDEILKMEADRQTQSSSWTSTHSDRPHTKVMSLLKWNHSNKDNVATLTWTANKKTCQWLSRSLEYVADYISLKLSVNATQWPLFSNVHVLLQTRKQHKSR